MNKNLLYLIPLIASSVGFAAQTTLEHPVSDFIRSINFSGELAAPSEAKPLVIAIVDDGFRLSHADLAPFIWTNPREIPGNRIDDDGNGCVDDVSGWDVADGDNDVAPPPGREAEFYHGTHLAGIIVQLARQAYGDDAAKWIKILPVKCLEDEADKAYLKSGYKGIQYAVDTRADIILTAWGEPASASRDLRILQSAEERGILIVASAGNNYSDDPQYPAAFPSVVAVAAIDGQWVRLKKSNYGQYVDLVAPGSGIISASSLTDDEYIEHDGTSMAAAIVAGALAVLKVQNPAASIEEITAILKNTASRVEPAQQGEILYGGKLGAGLVNLDRALNYDLDQQPGRANLQSNTHQGYLVQYQPRKSPTLWRIRPFGEVHGFWFDLKLLDGDPGDSRLKFLQAGTDPDQPFLDLKLSEIKDRVYVPGTQAMVLLEPDPEHPEFRLLVEYASKPIDQSTLYCQGTRKITAEGLIEDGSGQSPYSPQSDCKWLITAPEGKVVHIEFLEFDTEANTDWLYFFNGAGTNEKIMAVFSGPNIPPKLTTWHNQVLLWFVTDDKAQGQGWKAAISFIDPPPPAAP